jgi:AcrR family transcriptional regulator
MPKVSAEHLHARREQIIDAAVACFSRDGLHRTTMQHIVREARLSPGAIYRYFASKEAITFAIAQERHAREGELILEHARNPDRAQALLGLARDVFGMLASEAQQRERRVGIQMWAEALRDPKVLGLVRRGVDRPRALLAGLVRKASKPGRSKGKLQPDDVARVMIALFQGFILQQAWDPKLRIQPYLSVIEAMLGALQTEPKVRSRRPQVTRIRRSAPQESRRHR